MLQCEKTFCYIFIAEQCAPSRRGFPCKGEKGRTFLLPAMNGKKNWWEGVRIKRHLRHFRVVNNVTLYWQAAPARLDEVWYNNKLVIECVKKLPIHYNVSWRKTYITTAPKILPHCGAARAMKIWWKLIISALGGLMCGFLTVCVLQSFFFLFLDF